MQARHFFQLKIFGLLSLSGLLGACSPVYVSDAEHPMPAQPLLSNADCACNLSGMSVASPRTDLQAVYFDTASARLRAEAQAKLDAIANAIRLNDPTSVVIEGNTDSRGGERYNKGLGQRRAKAVRQGLISRGIAPDLLVIQSHGENRPVAPNVSAQNMQINRRVDVTLYLR